MRVFGWPLSPTIGATLVQLSKTWLPVVSENSSVNPLTVTVIGSGPGVPCDGSSPRLFGRITFPSYAL